MDRRRFLKYTGAAVLATGAAIAGLDFLIRPQVSLHSTTTSGLVSSTTSGSTTSSYVQAPLPDVPSRLLASTADFRRIQALVQGDPSARSLFDSLTYNAQWLLNEPPYQYDLRQGHDSQPTILSISRGVVKRIYTFGLMYRLGQGDQYLVRAWDELKAVAKFPDWDPAHFLDTAEMTHAVAIGYDWFPWNSDQRGMIREAIVNLGLKPALEAYAGADYGWWASDENNWNLVCNSGVGMGALAVAPEQPELAQQVLTNALKSLPIAMRNFRPDGGWFEGPVYWGYATLYTCVFLASMKTALGTDQGLSESSGFSETGLFPIYCTGPSNRTFNFADAESTRIQAAQMFWLSREFARPVYSSYAGGDDLTTGGYECSGPCAGLPLGLLWYQQRAQEPAASSMEPSKYFRGLELVTLRNAWGNRDSNFIGLKAGRNGRSHGHLDLGNFVIDALGTRWATDLGPDDYSLPGYFNTSGQRWTYYRMRAEGHNTIVLNPSGGPDQKVSGSARITRYKSDPTFSYAVADLTAAYSSVQQAKRGAGLSKDHLIIQDEIVPIEPLDLWWFMHTETTASIEDASGRTATLQTNYPIRRLWCAIAAPTDGRFELMDAKPLPSSPNPTAQTPNTGIKKLTIHLRLTQPSKTTTIAVMMYPQREGQEPPTQLPAVTPLDSW